MSIKVTDGFTSGDDEKVVSILDKWNGGPLSDELFTRVSKMNVLVSAICVIFRKNGENTEVLLLPRPNDDPTWPGLLNLPGKMFRPIDFERDDKNPINGPFERIQKDELNTKFKGSPKFSGIVFQDTKRGPIVALIYNAWVSKDSESNTDWNWIDVSKLKDLKNLLDTEMSAIEKALESYSAGSNHLPSL